ncbi:MAG: DUF3391 domain-containing protein [Burkholderiaceae bacterium]
MTQVAEKKTRKPKDPPQRAALDETDGSDVPAQLKRYRLAATDVVKGMFVAELDRPWLDTPFLLQGFLVETDDEVATLRKFSRSVFVDIELEPRGRRSDPRGRDQGRRRGEASEFFVVPAAVDGIQPATRQATERIDPRPLPPNDAADRSAPARLPARLLDRLLRLVGLGEAPVDREADARRRRAELRKCLLKASRCDAIGTAERSRKNCRAPRRRSPRVGRHSSKPSGT